MGELFSILLSLLTVKTLFWVGAGTLLGIVVGAVPGLTATMAVSLLLSITYGMSTADALAVLIAVYLGGIYGGSRSAILLNVPGTPSSAATCLDGFPLARKGEAAKASILVTLSSAIGGLIGVVILLLAAPLIARGALHIQVWEYFWLGIFGIAISANLTSSSLYKGLIAGMLGLLVTTIGIDPVYGGIRLIFGVDQLKGGISLVPALIGLFGFAEAIDTVTGNQATHIAKNGKESSLFSLLKDGMKMIISSWKLTLKSSFIGTFIGALPGVGPDIASWVSYDAAKRSSKEKELFGKGSYEGLMASETANNAATSGVFIPLLTLGIPGCAVSAVIMGGMILHGLRPGPTFFIEQREFVNYIVGILILSNIFIVIMGISVTKILSQVVKISSGVVMPVVIVFCIIGTYAVNYRFFDVTIMLAFGILGFIMKRIEMPAPPIVLGIILGDMVENNFRRGMIIDPNFLTFLTRPISIIILFTMIIMLFGPYIKAKLFKSNEVKL